MLFSSMVRVASDAATLEYL